MTANMEVKKDGLRQTQDGIWKLTLTIHPNDMPVDLMTAPMGTRYGLAMIQVEEGQEVNKPEQTEGDKLRVRAVMLCKDKQFQQYCEDCSPEAEATEELAKAHIIDGCGINSRSELATDIQAQGAFKEILADFHSWKLGRQYPDNLDRI